MIAFGCSLAGWHWVNFWGMLECSGPGGRDMTQVIAIAEMDLAAIVLIPILGVVAGRER